MSRKVGKLNSFGEKRTQTLNEDPSETIVSDAHLADINQIMTRFAKGGIVESLDEAQLLYGDVSEFTDLADALNQARLAEVEFLKLPRQVREVFEHDVAVWLDTAHDEDKRAALVEAGWIVPVEAITPKIGAPDNEKTPAGGKAEGGGSEITPE